jgi:hypothetical protein
VRESPDGSYPGLTGVCSTLTKSRERLGVNSYATASQRLCRGYGIVANIQDSPRHSRHSLHSTEEGITADAPVTGNSLTPTQARSVPVTRPIR